MIKKSVALVVCDECGNRALVEGEEDMISAADVRDDLLEKKWLVETAGWGDELHFCSTRCRKDFSDECDRQYPYEPSKRDREEV